MAIKAFVNNKNDFEKRKITEIIKNINSLKNELFEKKIDFVEDILNQIDSISFIDEQNCFFLLNYVNPNENKGRSFFQKIAETYNASLMYKVIKMFKVFLTPAQIGVLIESPFPDGNNILHKAFSSKSNSVFVALLLKIFKDHNLSEKAKINLLIALTPDLNTYLHCVYKSKDVSLVDLSFDFLLDIENKPTTNKTVLSFEPIMHMLQNCNNKGHSYFHYAICSEKKEIIQSAFDLFYGVLKIKNSLKNIANNKLSKFTYKNSNTCINSLYSSLDKLSDIDLFLEIVTNAKDGSNIFHKIAKMKRSQEVMDFVISKIEEIFMNASSSYIIKKLMNTVNKNKKKSYDLTNNMLFLSLVLPYLPDEKKDLVKRKISNFNAKKYLFDDSVDIVNTFSQEKSNKATNEKKDKTLTFEFKFLRNNSNKNDEVKVNDDSSITDIANGSNEKECANSKSHQLRNNKE